MAWPDDDLQPVATRTELLARVERRGREIRDRRRAALGVVAVVALLTVSVPVALTMSGGGGGRATEVAAVAGAVTTAPTVETTAAPEPEAPTTTGPIVGAAVPTTVRPQPGRSTTTTPSQTATTVSRAPQATQPPPAVSGAATTTTLPDPPLPRCGPDQIAVTLTPDKPAFGPGEMVTVTSTARNRTALPCYYASYTAQVTFKDAGGRSLAGMAGHADSFRDVVLAPFEVRTHQAQWHQQDCPSGPGSCGRAAPGDYLVTVSWSFYSPVPDVTAPFRLVP